MSVVMDTFASLLQFLPKHGRTDLACQLWTDGIRSMAQARSVAPACLAPLLQLEDRVVAGAHSEGNSVVAHSSHTAPHLVQTVHATVSVSKHALVKGSLSDALAVTTDPALRKRALMNFELDKYAGTSLGPRNSMWNTWCRICTAWQISPLPLTPETVTCVAASLKSGRYKSAANYFSRARQEHISVTGTAPTAAVEQAFRQAILSCERNLGGAAIKITFALEDIPGIQFDDHVPWNQVFILGAWFLTRGLELRSARRSHVFIDTARKRVTWHFPRSKTDTKAEGVSRTHGCCCTSSGEALLPELPLRQAPHPLCPFHCAIAYCQWWALQTKSTDGPLIPGNLDEPVPHAHICKQIAVAVRQVGVDLRSARPCDVHTATIAAEHALRVLGAQFMCRMGIDVYMIQLMGRWGSSAILRYIQDAPLQRQIWVASNAIAALSTQHTQSCVASSAATPGQALPIADHAQLDMAAAATALNEDVAPGVASDTSPQCHMVVNTVTAWLHKVEKGFDLSESFLWRTHCGWKFAQAQFRRTSDTHDGRPCAKCFTDIP